MIVRGARGETCAPAILRGVRMAQVLQTQYKSEADSLMNVLDFEGLPAWVSRRKRPQSMVPGRMLYVVNVRERDLAQAREIKNRNLFGVSAR
jgi:hypothetical protein